jgi:hypothetical protein
MPLFVLAGGEIAVACIATVVVSWVLRSGGLARLREVWREEPTQLLPPPAHPPRLRILAGGRGASGARTRREPGGGPQLLSAR